MCQLNIRLEYGCVQVGIEEKWIAILPTHDKKEIRQKLTHIHTVSNSVTNFLFQTLSFSYRSIPPNTEVNQGTHPKLYYLKT